MRFFRCFARFIAVAICAAIITAKAQAAPITYLFATLPARGTLDGVGFSEQSLAFKIYTDTDEISVPAPGLAPSVVGSATVQIGNGPEISITHGLGVVSDAVTGITMFSGVSRLGDALLRGQPSAVIDISRSTAGQVLFFKYFQWDNSPINTSAGVLFIQPVDNVVGTFAARLDPDPSPVPLPATGLMLVAALGGIGLGRRKSRRAPA